MTGLIIFLIIIAIIVIYLIAIYNGLVTSRNAYKNAFAQIDVQLTRRHDLIPNLVETAKGYLAHERGTLEAVTQARTAAVNGLAAAKAAPGDPEAMKQLSGSENQLTQALGRLFAVSEAYPDLKANQNMMQLSEELTSTENRVAFARQAYNDGDELQQQGRGVSVDPDCGAVRVHAGRAIGDRRSSEEGSPEGQLRLTQVACFFAQAAKGQSSAAPRVKSRAYSVGAVSLYVSSLQRRRHDLQRA